MRVTLKRIGLVGVMVVLGVVVVGVWKGENGGEKDGRKSQAGVGGHEATHPDAGDVKRRKDKRLATTAPKSSGQGQVYQQVEKILANDIDSNEEVAVKLREIAERADVSEEERLEALTHGLNLSVESFAGYGKDPRLPVVLAEKYQQELVNVQDDRVKLQGMLDLMANEHLEVSDEAATHLAFLLGDDELANNRGELMRVAAKKLEELAKPVMEGE